MSSGLPEGPVTGASPPRPARPTISDVSHAYRLFLGREVEDLVAASHHIAASASLWELIERIRLSGEAHNRAVGSALRDIAALHDAPSEAPAATGDQLEQLHRVVRAAWEAHGLGAYHHWLRRDEPRYDQRSRRWEIERRFAAGLEEAEALLRLCARHAYVPDGRGTFVTLGTDAYRLAESLAQRTGAYLGVEISEPGRVLAARAIAMRSIGNAAALHVSAFLEENRAIDFFHSVLALQHAPPPVILDLLETCLARVRSGGLAVFQLPSWLDDYRFDTVRYLEGEGHNPQGEIHAVPQSQILTLLARLDFTVLEVIPDGRIQSLGVSYLYVARRGRHWGNP